MSGDMVNFNRQVYTAITEIVDQQIQAFNEASNGALTLAPSTVNMGDFSMEAKFKRISNIVRRRDAANGTKPVTSSRLSQLKQVAVKVYTGTPPIPFEPSDYYKMLKSPELFAVIISEQLAPAILADQLNTAITGLVAAISGNAAAVNAITATASIASLTETAAKFGDRLGSIAAWVVHSKVMSDIWQNTLANSSTLFNFGNVAVQSDQFGRKFIMTDCPALINGDEYFSLGLVPQAALVEPNNDFTSEMVSATGFENIQRTYQAEWSYNLSLLGYSWNEANGGASPTDTALGTAANWTQVASSVKDTAGVLLKSA